MQFRRQGTKVFIKLELRKIHIFILQYSIIQLLLICQHTLLTPVKAVYAFVSTTRPTCSIGQVRAGACWLDCRPDAVHGRPGPVAGEVRQRHAGQRLEDYHGRL